jgi:hypothetical protein
LSDRRVDREHLEQRGSDDESAHACDLTRNTGRRNGP